MKRAVIDIETLADCFTLTALDYDSINYVQFEISHRKNDYSSMRNFLDRIEYFIGFNSIHFDEKVLLYIIKNNINQAKDIYKVAQEVIEFGDDFNNNQKFRNVMYNKPWISIDLFLYWSEGLRISKKLSLKYFAVNLDMNVEEMPIHHSRTNLTNEEIDQVLSYNLNDCEVTKALANKSVKDTYGNYVKDNINLRVWIKNEYKLDCLSWDSPKIANEILLEDYCIKTFNNQSEYWEYKKQIRATRYEKTKFKNGDYLPNINFKTKEFQNLYKEVCNSYNGFNKEILVQQSDASYIKVAYGSGGIHSQNKNENYISNSQSIVYTSDVSSLYPNLLINYKFIKPDLEIVLKKYTNVKEERIEAKKTKNKTKDAFLKLILNSLTGLLDNEYSWLYSPEYIMALRLMGQLLLTRLLEECKLNSLIVRSLNT